MPFIMSKVNVPVSAAQETQLKARLGKAMELLPGLSENYLLAGIEADCRFYLRGENQPVAYVEASIFGNEHHIGYENFSAAVTKIFVDVLNIPPLNVYIKFSDIAAWSVGGNFFYARLKFNGRQNFSRDIHRPDDGFVLRMRTDFPQD